MILLYGKNPMANVLHVITGPETDFWTQLHGAAAVDLTPVLQQMDHDQPVFLHVTRCDDEHETAGRLQSLMNAGNQYPFVPPTFVFTPVERDEQGNPIPPVTNPMGSPSGAGKPVVGPPEAAHKNTVKPAQKNRVNVHKGTCMRCQTKDVELVPKLIPAICYGCVQIDLHLAGLIDKVKEMYPDALKDMEKGMRGPKPPEDADTPKED